MSKSGITVSRQTPLDIADPTNGVVVKITNDSGNTYLLITVLEAAQLMRELEKMLFDLDLTKH